MSEVLAISAELRSKKGTGAARELRRQGRVPAVIYGAGKEAISISIAENEITKYYRQPQYISRLIEFQVGENKYKVLPKAIQLHPLTDVVRHADFVFLEKDIQKMQVPIVYKNKENCIGVKRGGYFNIVKRSLPLNCPVSNLPRKIEIDVTDVPIGTSIKAKELDLPEGISLTTDPEFVIASIIGRKGKSLEEEEAAEGEGAAEGEEGEEGEKNGKEAKSQ
ncbi:MAG: 50S ribosomal protein L25/general stress protein Ctc [Rickettsiaceae bacterium]|nr:50S ribosomal protein L25/general stress protein Ctc [Rickettsiaceae bacterium]